MTPRIDPLVYEVFLSIASVADQARNHPSAFRWVAFLSLAFVALARPAWTAGVRDVIVEFFTLTSLGGAVPRPLAPLATLNCIASFVGMLGQRGVHKQRSAETKNKN